MIFGKVVSKFSKYGYCPVIAEFETGKKKRYVIPKENFVIPTDFHYVKVGSILSFIGRKMKGFEVRLERM